MLPKREVGVVVGPGGEKIKRMRTETGCRIHIENDCVPGVEPPSQMITFQGTEQQIAAAVAQIQEARKEGMVGTPTAPRTEVTHKFPADVIPKIIGKSGATISSIRQRSGAHIYIENAAPGMPKPPEQAISFSGSPDQVSSAIGLVHAALAAAIAQEAAGPAPMVVGGAPTVGPNQAMLRCPRKRIGFLVGAKGKTIQEIRTMSGAKIDISNDVEVDAQNGENQSVTISGPESSVKAAVFYISEIINKAEDTPPQAGAPNGVSAVAGGFETAVDCPKSRVGMLVGSKGKTIQEIRMAFGCRIDIANEEPFEGAGTQRITISGEQSAVLSAAAHITELITAPEGQTHSVNSTLTAGPHFVKVNCPKERVAKLVGPKGVHIQTIRSHYRVKVDLANEPEYPGAEHQVVTISGEEADVAAAAALVSDVCNGNDFTHSSTTTTTLPCPKARVGKVVGPQGATINLIRTKYQVKVDLANEPEYPGADHQVITISGEVTNVTAAMQELTALISDRGGAIGGGPPAAQMFAPPPSYPDLYAPPNYGNPYYAPQPPLSSYSAAPPPYPPQPTYEPQGYGLPPLGYQPQQYAPPPPQQYSYPPAHSAPMPALPPPTMAPPLLPGPPSRHSLPAPLPPPALPSALPPPVGASYASYLPDPLAAGKRSAEAIAGGGGPLANKAPRADE